MDLQSESVRQSIRTITKRIGDSSRFNILVILLGAVIMGALILDDYGQSWDEVINDKAGARALNAYQRDAFLQDH